MIIASVSTIPGRLEGLMTVLEKFQMQTKRPDKLLVIVAKYYPRMDRGYPEEDKNRLIEYLSKYSIPNELIVLDKDIGPSVKLTVPLKYLEDLSDSKSNNDDVIFIFDDDSIPYVHAIEFLYDMYQKHGDAAWGLMGVSQDEEEQPKFLHGEFIQDRDFMTVDVLGGYRGVLYPVHIFTNGEPSLKKWLTPFLDRHEQENLIAMHDDHLFAYYCQYKNIERRVIRLQNGNGYLFYEPLSNTDGIFNDERSGKSFELITQIMGELI